MCVPLSTWFLKVKRPKKEKKRKNQIRTEGEGELWGWAVGSDWSLVFLAAADRRSMAIRNPIGPSP